MIHNFFSYSTLRTALDTNHKKISRKIISVSVLTKNVTSNVTTENVTSHVEMILAILPTKNGYKQLYQQKCYNQIYQRNMLRAILSMKNVRSSFMNKRCYKQFYLRNMLLAMISAKQFARNVTSKM